MSCTFRFNTRLDLEGEKLSDGDRFVLAMRQILEKRLTYKSLIGENDDESRVTSAL